MTPEDAYRQWDELDSDDRLAAMGDVANDYLVSNGYDNVDVQSGDLESGTFAETDTVTGDITFDDQSLTDASADTAFMAVYHETWHAMDAQDGVFDRLPEDEQQNFNELGPFVGYFDDQGELRVAPRSYVVPEHDDAQDFGEAMAAQVAQDAAGDGGGGAPPPAAAGTESASDRFQFEILWDKVVVTNASDAGYAPDFDHAVVTSVPASDAADHAGVVPGGETEYWDGSHAVPSP